MLDLKRTFLQSYLHFRHPIFSNQQATPGKCFPLYSINDENFIFNIQCIWISKISGFPYLLWTEYKFRRTGYTRNIMIQQQLTMFHHINWKSLLSSKIHSLKSVSRNFVRNLEKKNPLKSDFLKFWLLVFPYVMLTVREL
jgi:hypothetical protein